MCNQSPSQDVVYGLLDDAGGEYLGGRENEEKKKKRSLTFLMLNSC